MRTRLNDTRRSLDTRCSGRNNRHDRPSAIRMLGITIQRSCRSSKRASTRAAVATSDKKQHAREQTPRRSSPAARRRCGSEARERPPRRDTRHTQATRPLATRSPLAVSPPTPSALSFARATAPFTATPVRVHKFPSCLHALRPLFRCQNAH